MCVISQLLHLSLKKSKVTSSEASSLEMLDPFVLLLLDCLNSMHVKVLAFYVYMGICHHPKCKHRLIRPILISHINKMEIISCTPSTLLHPHPLLVSLLPPR